MYSSYSDDLNLIGYQQEKTVLEGGKANYRIEIIEAASMGFTAHAIAVIDFDGDGQFNTWSINQDKELLELTSD